MSTESNTIWEQFLDIAKDEAGSRVVETWLKAVSLEQWDAIQKVAYLKVPNKFVKDWIEANYYDLVQVNLCRLLNTKELKLIFSLNKISSKDLNDLNNNSRDNKDSNKNNKANIVPATLDQVSEQKKNILAKRKKGAPVNTGYRFDNFVIGPNNTLAHAAAQAVARNPGMLYNPLFIYGNSGLGKTHLLYAIGNQIKQDDPGAVILYQTTDRFVSEFINAIRFNKVFIFKEKYKNIDVLLIDDIQFISNKEQTQEAFFHIFNALYESRKQVVFSSDAYPKDISGLADRLRSRLEWGLITDVHRPSLETKIAILKKKAEQHNENLSDDILYYIADKAISNIRELEGILVRVLAFSNLTNQPLSLELVKKVLDAMPQKVSISSNLENIAVSVGKAFSYNLMELRSQSRSKDLSLARQISMYLMKKMTEKSMKEIGLFLNRKDHSTVSYAIDKISKKIKVDMQIKSKIDQVLSNLN